jgi:hypothetical protein
MPVICVRTKAEYFSIPGLTRFLKIRSDLPVAPLGRTPLHEVALGRKANQFAAGSFVGWAKRSVLTTLKLAR